MRTRVRQWFGCNVHEPAHQLGCMQLSDLQQLVVRLLASCGNPRRADKLTTNSCAPGIVNWIYSGLVVPVCSARTLRGDTQI